MAENINIYFTGTAGSGKTTMVAAFRDWMSEHGYDSIPVNLDPGAEVLPYTPEVDIRHWLRLDEVIEQFGLGPNGAQVAAADLIAVNAEKVREAFDDIETDYFLMDTPGQIELFAFRDGAPHTIDVFGRDRSMVVFIFDPTMAQTPSGFVSLLMLSATVQFRLGLPQINVLGKADTLDAGELNEIMKWSLDYYALYNAVLESKGGMEKNLAVELFQALDAMGALSSFFPVSSLEKTGFEDIYTVVQQVFAGGEDLEPR